MEIRHDMICCFVARPGPGGPAGGGGESHEFLQLRRAASDFMGGTWQPVSGTIQAGETAWQAALRELAEESGLTPRELYVVGVSDFYLAATDTLWHRVAFCAVVDREAAVTLNEEHDAYRWVGRSTTRETFMWADEWRLLDELGRLILDGGSAKEYLAIALDPPKK